MNLFDRYIKQLGCLSCFFLFSMSFSAEAQLIPDNSLDGDNSIVTPSGNRDLIQGGTIRQNNLFHSFQEFNVNNRQKVYFSNPDNITNILTRVTGTNASKIFGTLGVNGNANLFLINPNGIIFGENAFLDISGSFNATTAESIFTDNYEFSTANPERGPLLKVNITPGLQYGKGSIRNRGNLRVGKDLGLSAGNLDLIGNLSAGGDLNLLAADTIKIEDNLNNPFIASSGDRLLIRGDQIDIFTLNNRDSGFFSNAETILTSANTIQGEARFYSGGRILFEGNLSSTKNPTILAGGDVILGDYTGASLHILAGGNVTLGDVEINATEITPIGPEARSRDHTINSNNTVPFNSNDRFTFEEVTLSDGRIINVDGFGKPTLDVRAGIDWNGNVNLPFDAATRGDITVGNIKIADGGDGGQLLFTNQYRSNVSKPGNILLNGIVDARDTFGGGKLDFDSRGGITLNGIINASELKLTTANGGDISLLAAGDITFNDGAGIVSNGLISGNIILNAMGDSYRIISLSFTEESGVTGGNIDITANSLFLRDGAFISTNTFGGAVGGNLNINATSLIELTGEDIDGNTSIISSNVLQGATGNSGDVNIKAGNLIIRDGGLISTLILGDGNAGELKIIAEDIELIGSTPDGEFISGVSTSVSPQVSGNSGDLTIETQNLIVRDGAQISTTSFGNGNAGELKIIAKNIKLIGTTQGGEFNSGVFADVNLGATGNAGNLTIETQNLIVADGSVVAARTFGNGNAGELKIIAENIKLTGTTSDLKYRSGLSTKVNRDAKGDGGILIVESQNLTITDNAEISTLTNGDGKAGRLDIKAFEINVSEGGNISTAANLTGRAGEININTHTLELNNATINASTTTTDAGGNINTKILGN